MITVSLGWWAAIAFAAQAAAVNLAGFLRIRLPGGFGGPAWRVPAPYVRALWFIGVPYLALISGAATLRQYALVDLDWRQTLGAGVPMTLLGFALGALVIWLYGRGPMRAHMPDVLPAEERRAQASEPWGVAFVLLDSLSLQAHWLLYRAGATLALNDPNLGALAGIALVALEWAADMRLWLRARTPGQADDLLMQAGLLVLSTVVFVFTRNFWFSLAAHALVWLGWLALMQWIYRPLTTTPPHADGDALSASAHDA